MGSTLMAAFIAKASMDDDDEEEGFIQNLLKTKMGRRFLQKHLPLGVAMLSPYVYGGNTAKDNALDRVLTMVDTYTGKDFESYGNLRKSLKFAKTDEERNEVWGKFWGNLFTTYNVNQPEQLIKFRDAIESAFDTDEIRDVEENEKRSKELYQEIDSFIDGFLINGAISAAQRAANPNEDVNRFTKK